MLDSSILGQLREIFSELKHSYTLEMRLPEEHEIRAEMMAMMEDFASTSKHISTRLVEGELLLSLLRDDEPTGVGFRALPSGHEFSSLVLSLLNADGQGRNLPDEFTLERIASLPSGIEIVTYLSLECTNCPDVVQSLNVIALNNSGVSHTGVDGSLFEEEVSSLGIKSVPTVYANGEPLHIGRGSLGELLGKLEERFGRGDITIESGERRESVEYDILVAGGGAAGCAAAIYSVRKGLSVAVVTDRVGGQVNETDSIENLITVAHSSGGELASGMRSLLVESGVTLLENRIIKRADREETTKQLTLNSGEILHASQLIIATGAQWRRLNVEGEEEYIGRGVAFCPHCDGPLFRGRRVAVVGGGNSGVEAAIDLSGICSDVVLIEFMERLKADQVLVDKALSIDNITIHTNCEVRRLEGDGTQVTTLVYRSRSTKEEVSESIDGVFVQIGLVPNSSLFEEMVEINERAEIVTTKSGRTSMSGVYAAGDVTDVDYKQIIISMGEGAKAALSAFDDRMRGIK